MSNSKVILRSLLDKNNNKYYVGHLAYPGYLDFDLGVTFLVFNSESGEEELQIAVLDSDSNNFSNYQIKSDRVSIRLHAANDRDKKKFFVSKIEIPGQMMDFSKGVDFVIFTSKEGAEELQMVGELFDKDDLCQRHVPANRTRKIEVIKKVTIND